MKPALRAQRAALEGRAPRGARGLKLSTGVRLPPPPLSRPARGAWIETNQKTNIRGFAKSRPARGAWIETGTGLQDIPEGVVAPRAGRVD